jgi:hypothetical protein
MDTGIIQENNDSCIPGTERTITTLGNDNKQRDLHQRCNEYNKFENIIQASFPFGGHKKSYRRIKRRRKSKTKHKHGTTRHQKASIRRRRY